MTRIVNPLEHPDWNNVLLSYPGASFFHTSTWAEVLQRSYHYKPLYLTIDGNGKMAVLPIMEVNSHLTGKRGVSLPFSDYCEPIVSNDDQFKEIFNYVTDYGKKKGWKYIELRGGEEFLRDITPYSQYFGHTLELLQKEENIFSGFRKGTKSAIKKSITDGVEVKICDSMESIQEFCRLNSITRKRHGLPPQPHSFFKNVYHLILSKNMGIVVLASFQEKTIAASIFFHIGEKAIWKYGASDMNFQHLRPNNLITWEAIRWYCKNGFESLCFGRTEQENRGLQIFKNGWGTEEHIIKYYKYDLRKDSFIRESPKISAFQHNIFNRLPISILNALGTLFYRHMG